MPAKKPPEEPPEAEVVDGQEELPVEVSEAVREAVADAQGNAELVVRDPGDAHEGMVAMDAADAARFVERLTTQAQEQNLGKRWVYELDGGKTRGLTGDAVEDITQQMNWTGRCRIHALPETLTVETEEVDDPVQPFRYVATIFAADDVSGATHSGTSSEPQKMKLKSGDLKWDRFARAKAINKAERNALEKHIPTIVKLTLIAMAAKNPQLVEHIQSEAEAKVAELPPPLDTIEAKALIAEIEGIYDEVKALGGGRGRLLVTPGQFGAYMLQSQHDMDRLGNMRDWLLARKGEIEAEVGV